MSIVTCYLLDLLENVYVPCICRGYTYRSSSDQHTVMVCAIPLGQNSSCLDTLQLNKQHGQCLSWLKNDEQTLPKVMKQVRGNQAKNLSHLIPSPCSVHFSVLAQESF